MAAYKHNKGKTSKNKTPKTNKNIEKSIYNGKNPKLVADPMQYNGEKPTWSFKRMSKENVWIFTPKETICISNETFDSKCIIAKLAEYENLSWNDIKLQTHGKHRKSKHHFVHDNIDKLHVEARRRLNELEISENIFSLRLSGKERIYGILESKTLEILWYDQNHEIYPTDQ
jgi:hypothetical protein